jgi:DNA-binding NarL/FixJ family response regulator
MRDRQRRNEQLMSAASAVANVFLLTENRLLREALGRILGRWEDLKVVGAAPFSSGVVDQIANASADLVLLDSIPVAFSDQQLIQVLQRRILGVKVVMVGMDPDAVTFLRLVREGVVGYILKEASASEVIAAVRAVASGEAVCPPQLNIALFRAISRPRVEPPSLVLKLRLGLTRREQQLVELIAQGLTNKEIATSLNLSDQTVKNHVHRVLRKLGASDRLTAVEMCRTHRLTS